MHFFDTHPPRTQLRGSRRDQKIMGREVELDPHVSSEEIKRREVELDPQVSPEEIMGRWRWNWAAKVGLLSLWVVLSTAVQRTLSFVFLTEIVLVTLPSTAVETAIAQCTSRWAMARGHRFNTSVVLAAVHGLSGPFRAVSAVEPSLSRPLPSCPRP